MEKDNKENEGRINLKLINKAKKKLIEYERVRKYKMECD